MRPVASGAQRWRYEGTTPGSRASEAFTQPANPRRTDRRGCSAVALRAAASGTRDGGQLQRQVARSARARVRRRIARQRVRRRRPSRSRSATRTPRAAPRPRSRSSITGVGQFAMSGPGSGFEGGVTFVVSRSCPRARGTTVSRRRAAPERARRRCSWARRRPESCRDHRSAATTAASTDAEADAEADPEADRTSDARADAGAPGPADRSPDVAAGRCHACADRTAAAARSRDAGPDRSDPSGRIAPGRRWRAPGIG